MNTVIDRDEEQQKAFGEKLVTFSEDMRAVCQSLKGHIADGYDNIQADNARGALDYLLELVEDIEDKLPGVEEFGTKQKVLAKRISDAAGKRFSR